MEDEVIGSEDTQDSGVAVQDSPESTPQQGGNSPHQPAQAAPQQQAPSWAVMENFRRLPQFQGMGEQQIAQSLYQAMQREQAASQRLAQYQQYMPYTQQYLADRPQYEAWKKSQQVQSHPQVQAAGGAQPEKPKQSWWNPPEVKESYKQYLVRDPETGKDVIHPDAPLDARNALAEYQSFKTNFAKTFLEDPEKALGPMVEGRAKEIAETIVNQALKQRDNESFVDQIRDTNSDWLFDQQGNVTPEGLAVHKYVEQARGMGIASPQDRWQYARDRVEHELLLRDFEARQQAGQFAQQRPMPQQFAQQPQPQQPDPEAVRAAKAQQNMEYLRREAARSPSRSAGTTNNDPRAPKQKQSFEQMLMADASTRGLI